MHWDKCSPSFGSGQSTILTVQESEQKTLNLDIQGAFLYYSTVGAYSNWQLLDKQKDQEAFRECNACIPAVCQKVVSEHVP